MSVNGRPFRLDPTSYQMTGIPCGNPARYKSKGVIRMVPDKAVPFEDQQIGIPGKGTMSEAEIEFQKLVKNQLDTTYDYAQNKKVNFTSSSKENMVGSARGFMTLSQFQKTSEGDKKTNEMRGLGFSDTQINHLLEQEGLIEKNTSSRKRKFEPHPDFVKQGIDEMLEAKGKRDAQLEEEANAPLKISRHRQQLEAAILQGKSHLPLAHLYLKSGEGRREEGEELEPALMEDDETNGSSPSLVSPTLPSPPSPLLSAPEPPKPVIMTNKVDSLSEEEIKKNRMSYEEIQKLFPNHEKGAPNKVLYVKNLEKKVTPEDLVSIFIRFQKEGKEKIGFKMMSGKMKGQAFITFPDEATAMVALDLVHGYVYKGKPIIIQFKK